jgi:prepilin-type N-terminal cleavage/methylation domain-containing protein
MRILSTSKPLSVGTMRARNAKAKINMKRRGFTISELLLVVLVIGLITSAGTGLYVGTFRGMKVRKAAQDFFLTAEYARIMAMERQTPYRLEMDLANRGFSLTTLRWDEESGQVGLETVKDVYCKPVQFDGDVTFEAVEVVPGTWEVESTTPEQQTIVFSPDGTSQSAVVQIGDGKAHYTVSISAATGSAKVQFGTADNVKVTTIDLDAQ